MAYVVPQVLVFQELQRATTPSIQRLNAHVSGGHAMLIRHAVADEKPLGALGEYTHTLETGYAWPNRPAGAVVDRSYTKLFIDDAMLKYFEEASDGANSLTTVAGYPNRIASPTLSWKENGDDYPRSAAFLDRDVKIGDAVRLRAVVDGDDFELCTHVAGFVATPTAADVADGTPDADNADTQSADTDGGPSPDEGQINCVGVDIITNEYNGLADGVISEVYTIRVIQGSVGGDHTTALLQITSASGTDDVAEVAPAEFGTSFEIGTRGLLLNFDDDVIDDCSASAEADDVSADDLLEGQVWNITVAQAYTANLITGDNGIYTGTIDDTYIIEVLRGGLTSSAVASEQPQIIVRTVHGSDYSGPTNVTDANKDAVPVGTKGLTVEFSSSNTKMVTGDKWYVEVTAAATAAIKTLALGHSLPQAVIDNGATDIELSLYIRKDIEVEANRIGFAPLINWEQSDTEITIYDGIVAYDDSWTDDGVPVELPVEAACERSQVYVEVRYWLNTLANRVHTIEDVADIDTLISGETHPDNELKFAVLKALQNANGTPVKFTAVCDPSDADSWLPVIDLLDGSRDVYGLVPLTRDPLVWSLFQAHVASQSSATANRWRVAWFNQAAVEEKVISSAASSDDDELLLAVLEDDPDTSGTQYTQLRVSAGNADFVTDGVRAGDVVRYLYGVDGFGNESYETFVVDSVVNNDTLRLQTGHDAAVLVAEKVEIWRTLTVAEQAAELALTAGFSDRRVRMVWPDTLGSDGFTVAGYFLCAALAGLASGVVPQRGLTRTEIAGFEDADRTVDLFSATQLNVMAGGGVWIVSQDRETGEIFSRHAVTTGDTDDILEREEMIVRNSDSISFFFLDVYDPYIGVANVAPTAIEILTAETRGAIKRLESSFYVDRLGPQLISGTITELRAHAIEKDRVIVVLTLIIPSPLNVIEVRLALSV